MTLTEFQKTAVAVLFIASTSVAGYVAVQRWLTPRESVEAVGAQVEELGVRVGRVESALTDTILPVLDLFEQRLSSVDSTLEVRLGILMRMSDSLNSLNAFSRRIQCVVLAPARRVDPLTCVGERRP